MLDVKMISNFTTTSIMATEFNLPHQLACPLVNSQE